MKSKFRLLQVALYWLAIMQVFVKNFVDWKKNFFFLKYC